MNIPTKPKLGVSPSQLSLSSHIYLQLLQHYTMKESVRSSNGGTFTLTLITVEIYYFCKYVNTLLGPSEAHTNQGSQSLNFISVTGLTSVNREKL